MRTELGALLRGKVAIISGGGRGIGAATAETLAHAGAKVMVAARTAAEIEAVAEGIRATGGEAKAVPTDITDAKQVQSMVQQTIDLFGRVDFLINCAAVVGPVGRSAWEADPEAGRQVIDINICGLFLTCHAVLPYMLQQGSGRLINVSSGAGEIAIPYASAYCATRAATNQFFRVLAAELLGTGVTANIVYPGITDTRGLREFRSAWFGENRGQLWRYQGWLAARDPFQPARLFLWLCSPSTSSMTGQIVAFNNPIVQRRLASFLYDKPVNEPELY